MKKVIIIGCGNVGVTYAYSLISTHMNIDEIVLIDKNQDKLQGDYLDLSHSLYYSENNIKLKIGDYSDIEDADIICITAGISQSKNTSRLDDIEDTKKIFKDITDNIKKYNFKGIFLIASNPNDVMCYSIKKYLNYDPKKILGSGISLDTSRLIDIVSKRTNKEVEGYVLGEHGNSAFIPWSHVYINNEEALSIFDKEALSDILDEVHNVSREIINHKQATYYGVSTCLCKITKCILDDIDTVMPLSCYDEENDVFIGNLAEINKDGLKEIKYLDLSVEEEELYKNSVQIIKEYNEKL